MKLVRITDDIYQENCYICLFEKDAYVIDPGFSYDKIIAYLNENEATLKYIFLTHGHIDHTGDMDKLIRTYKDAKILISEEDSALLFDENLNVSKLMGKGKVYQANSNIELVDFKRDIDGFRFYKTPGHTKGSLIILIDNFLFTGDTLFNNSIGRTDFPTGSMGDMNSSLKSIKKSFSKGVILLPGHGSKTTLKDELKNNQYLKLR